MFRSPISPTSETSSIMSHDIDSLSSFANSSGVDNSTNYQRNGRAKWSSYPFDAFSKDNVRGSRSNNGPEWLEKSLGENRDSEDDAETMSISMRSVSSFLRGQNVPVEPHILAEREVKRRKAIELQHAIKQQLNERENLKRMEREKQLQTERLEEERIARQMEKERKRLEYEQNLQYEKIEAERKKEEAMRKALEKAAIEAQKEKERRRREKVVMQVAIDETISVQKIGERTEISIVEKPSNETFDIVENEVTVEEDIKEVEQQEEVKVTNEIENNHENDEDDGETVLIGTPIKLRKKNLEDYRKKFAKRQQNVEERVTSDDETPKSPPPKSATSIKVQEKQQDKPTKMFSDMDNLALLLQSLPIVPIMPISTDFFGLNNQLNNLALLMSAQNHLNSPNNNFASYDKIDISQLLKPPCSPQTITLQIQQVEMKSPDEEESLKIHSLPSTPAEKLMTKSETFDKLEENEIKTTIPISPPLPHEGTFTINKDDSIQTLQIANVHCDASTSTTTTDKNVKILTPQKYRRHEFKSLENLQTIGTQTESFLFCEYCSYQHQKHSNQHHSCVQSQADDTDGSQVDSLRESEKKMFKHSMMDNRPKWGARNPPVKYLKASERDPWHGKNRKRRYLKKAMSESEKSEDTSNCIIKQCPLLKSPSTPPSMSTMNKQVNRENICKNLVPIKYDRHGRICVDQQKFLANEAFRRVGQMREVEMTSDAESSIIDIKHRSFFPRGKDFQDIFVD
jgi:hypothetical protein